MIAIMPSHYTIVTLVRKGGKLLQKDELLAMYEKMLLIRYFENEVEKNVARSHLHGTTHLYNGQEAIAVGVCTQLQQGDYITSTHRGHGHAIALGADVRKMMAEMFGKVTGYSKGKGGSMHIADIEAGNLGSNGIVGGGIPIAVGAGLSLQMQGRPNVVVSFFGDGAINEGSFHESLNLASIWQVPVIFVCENNVYGMSSPIAKMTNIEYLSDRAVAYGMPGYTVDGNDLLAMIDATQEAIDLAKSGGGPTLIEAKTYRFKGHSRSDKEKYRTETEVALFKQEDPLLLVEKTLCDEMGLVPAKLDMIQDKVKTQVQAATDFALESDAPALEELYTDVYA